MMAIDSRTMTLDEFLRKHEDSAVLEYCRGVVSEKMAPSFPHSAFAGVIVQQVNGFAQPRKLAFTFPELRITDPATGLSRVPDLSVFVWDRIQRDRLARDEGASIPPDIAIEIASPGQSRRKQVERCLEFIELGARIALMVDPRTQTIVDVRTDGVVRRLRGDDVLDLTDVIPGFTLVVGELFAAARFE